MSWYKCFGLVFDYYWDTNLWDGVLFMSAIEKVLLVYVYDAETTSVLALFFVQSIDVE